MAYSSSKSSVCGFRLSDDRNVGYLHIRLIAKTKVIVLPGGEIETETSDEYSVALPINPLFHLVSPAGAVAFFSAALAQYNHFNFFNPQFRTQIVSQMAGFAHDLAHGGGQSYGLSMLAIWETEILVRKGEERRFPRFPRPEFADSSLIFETPSFPAAGFDGLVTDDISFREAILPLDDSSSSPPGLSDYDISRLQRVRFDGKSRESCCVCIDEICDGAVIILMPCSHKFHGKCIAKWLRTNGSCPVCRSRVLPYDNNNNMFRLNF